MQRRTFFKALVGLLAGGVGVLLGRDHVREVTKKVKTAGTYTTYETEVVNLNADMLYVTKSGVYRKGTMGDWKLVQFPNDMTWTTGRNVAGLV